MQVKFGRNYLLQIQSNDALGTTVTIQPPFTIEFDVTRSQFSSANQASIRIYNLGKNTRSQLRKDLYDNGNLKRVLLQVGYGTSLSTILTGDVQQAWSVREGTNFITTITAFESGFAYANAFLEQTQFPANTSKETIIRNMIGSLGQYGVAPGSIGSFPGNIPRGNSYSGNTIQAIQEVAGQNKFFIDGGKAHCLNDNECLDLEIFEINAQTGLLGTPVREVAYFNFEMILEPSLRIGQLIHLVSTTGEDFNGICRVNSLHHRGMISESVAGEAITSVGSLAGSYTTVPNG